MTFVHHPLPGDAFGELMVHGGAIDVARRLFPLAPEPWIDLSTGINPLGYPVPALDRSIWTRLPDRAQLDALERAAAGFYRVPAASSVLAAAGTQSVLQILPSIFEGRDVRILGPTYGDYQRLYRAAGSTPRLVPRLEQLAGADVAIVVNPNNPDGRTVRPEAVLQLAPRVGALIVDEAFADAEPADVSVIPHLGSARLLVLRSFGKFFGCAGVRLGFAVGSGDRFALLRERLGPWPVSGPAIAIGSKALNDSGWAEETRARLRSDAARLAQIVRGFGAEVVGATALFCLASHPAASLMVERWAQRGILLRPFRDQPTWLRFGLPGAAHEWTRVAEAARACR